MIDYETALLGAVLSGYRDIPKLTGIVSGPDFYQPLHEQVWDAVVAVHGVGNRPDALTVRAELDERHGSKWGRDRGPLYLVDLVEACPVISSAAVYAEKVREQAVRRQIRDLGTRCLQAEAETDLDTADLVGQIRDWTDGVTAARTSDMTGIESALEQVIDVAERGEKAGIPYPWKSLNELVDGMHPGQLVTFAARPGVGKSIALENVATHIARSGVWVTFASLEMSPKEITQRTMAHTARVQLTNLRRGYLSEVEWTAVSKASEMIAQTKIRFADRSGQTVASIRAAAWETRQHAIRQGEQLGAVVIDYIQLITHPKPGQMTRQQQLGDISRGLKQLARELGVPVITAAQLKRLRGAVPILDDLRESGDIEQDSDVAVLLHEDEIEEDGRTLKTGDIDLIVAKNRNGPSGVRTIQKYGHYARLDEDRP